MNPTDDPDYSDVDDIFTDITTETVQQSETKIVESNINVELPIPLPFEGWIYKQSRFFKTFRKRFCTVSLKHAILCTYPTENKLRCTEMIRLKNYNLNKGVLNDKNIVDKLNSANIKLWDKFALIPFNKIYPTFLFCGSCANVNCYEQSKNGKYIKNAVICAMSYRLARLAIKQKEWIKAKYNLWLFACNIWSMEKAKNSSINDRFIKYEKWIQIALNLPFDLNDKKQVEQQCMILRSYAFYMMNVYGDRCDKLGNIYKEIIDINANDGIVLTYYGKWLFYGSHTDTDVLKAEACLRKAMNINNGYGVFLNHVIDDNIKSIRFGKEIYADKVLKEYLIRQGRKVDSDLCKEPVEIVMM
eukprot:198391_1